MNMNPYNEIILCRKVFVYILTKNDHKAYDGHTYNFTGRTPSPFILLIGAPMPVHW